MRLKKLTKPKKTGRMLVLYLLGLLLAFSNALPTYVHSNFLGEIVSLQMVSLFFIIANSITFAFIIFFPKIIKKFNDHLIFKAILVLCALSLFSFSIADTAIKGLISISAFMVAFNLVFIKLDLFLEKFTDNNNTGRIRTIYFTFYNLGWVFAPSVSSFLIEKFSYSFVYWIAGLLIIPVLIIFAITEKRFDKKIKYTGDNIKKEIIRMLRCKNLRGIFIVALIIQLFFSTAVVYVPFYLHQNLGIGWEVLGPIFSIMLLPFVLFEIPAGILADKYFGEKEMLIIGLVILSLSLFFFYYIDVPTAWIWALVLFLSRTGAAILEAMRESYFFKLVDAENIDMINIFRITSPLAYIIGPGIAILILAFFPVQYLFLFMSIITILGIGVVLPIKDSR